MLSVTIHASTPYEVTIDRGLFHRLASQLKDYQKRRVVLVSDRKVYSIYGRELTEQLEKAGLQTMSYVAEPGESAKSFQILEDLLESMVAARIQRSDLVLAFGGGVIGDLAGLAAGLYQRGIDYIQIPTTLLAAVDSSVGGKTAINSQSGKNLIGIFKQPKAVFCDPNLFSTLEPEDFRSGLAEVIKYGVLFDQQLFERLSRGVNPEDADLEDIVAKCVGLKAKVVAEDEFDRGVRALLNLGHTIGHGIEKLSCFEIRHGHAVAIGMAMIARACVVQGLASPDTSLRIEEALEQNHLPINTEYSAIDLAEAVRGDKKADGDSIQAILIRGIGQCEIKSLPLGEFYQWIERGK
ncbi:MAG: 3-dehydroquinate synthase [Tissierellia bacterium]|nr:3-dehydroquinate synthase [Tissierellia bacterium]